jgi:hypothetical protein
VLGRPAGETIAEDGLDVVGLDLVPPVDQQDLRRLVVGLAGLLRCFQERPRVLEVPVEDGDPAESLAQEILDHEPHDLLQHAAGQAHGTGEVPAAAAARPGVGPVEHRRGHDQPAPGARLGGDVLRDERVSAQRQMGAVLFDRADGQHDGGPGLDLGPDLRRGHLFQPKRCHGPSHVDNG